MAFNYEFPYTDPNLYNDDWLLKKVKELVAEVADLDEWREEFQDSYDAFMEFVAQLEAGNFPESLEEGLVKWMRENALSLVGELVKLVFFGLNDDGYFVAYIPESWADIIFNTTDLDILIPGYDYGHLVLSMNIGGY